MLPAVGRLYERRRCPRVPWNIRFQVGADAEGQFALVTMVDEPTTLLLACKGAAITRLDRDGTAVSDVLRVPTLSDWALVILVLLTLTAGTVLFACRIRALAGENGFHQKRPWRWLANTALVIALSTSMAAAQPKLFLSLPISSNHPGDVVQFDVFVEEVLDLRLYEVVLDVVASPDAVGMLNIHSVAIKQSRPDFVFAGILNLVCLPDPANARITCTPLSGQCVVVEATPEYLGTFVFLVSSGTSGSFRIEISDDPASFLLDCDGRSIAPVALTHAMVEVTCAPGDVDLDVDVDLFDFADFVACVTGPGMAFDDPACQCVDFDADGDVDLRDFAEFQRVFTDSRSP